jgi:diguanylate cyclase (GGDEF)-like protein
MSRPSAGLRRWLSRSLLAALLSAAPAWAAPGSPEARAEDQQLAEWVRRSNDHPQQMLAQLTQHWPDTARADGPREIAWQFARGQMLLAGADFDSADKVAARLIERPGGADRGWLLRGLIEERQSRPVGSLAQRALSGLDKACALDALAKGLPASCDYTATWQALRLRAREEAALGALAAAETTWRQSLALAQAAADPYLTAISHARLAAVLQGLDRLDEMHQSLKAAHVAAGGDSAAAANVRNTEAVIARAQHDLPAARAAMEEALALAERGDQPRLAAQLRTNLVDVLLGQGQTDAAVRTALKALPELQRFKDRFFERTLRHNLALGYIKLHQFDAARRELTRVNELGLDPNELVGGAVEWRELAEAWAEAGRYSEALAAYHAETDLLSRANERRRESALEDLRRKYDTTAKQRDLDLLARDGQLKDQQLANRQLAQQVGLAVGVLLLLSIVLVSVVLVRMRQAHRKLQANQVLLRAQSERDPLTNLSNRRHFLTVMEQLGTQEFHGALLMIDIDHFKNVNDWHGHSAGDLVIVEVGKRITQAVRGSDLVVRWGGEEFLVFAPELATDDLSHLAGRILTGIGAKPVHTDAGELRITASLGFASFPLGSGLKLHWEQAINWADMALYKAKAEGRNRAIGIVGVQAPAAEMLGDILQDFDAACRKGQVQLNTLLGPA